MEEDVIDNMTTETKRVKAFLGRYQRWPEKAESVAHDVARRYLVVRHERDALKAELEAVNGKLNNERGEVTTLQMELGSMEVRVVYAEAELQQARAYVNALIDGLTADQLCGLVEARKVDDIRAWLEVGNPPAQEGK